MANQQLSTNTFGTARWIVSPTASDGTHTTIASALTAASSGDTIFIRPGTYTEDLSLKAGVNLTAYTCDAFTPNVTIIGKATFTAGGTVSISGIQLQTNSDFLLAVTGSAASIVNLISCSLNCTNNTGISFTTSSSSAQVFIRDCSGDLGTTGISFISSSSAGTARFFTCIFGNSGGSTTANTASAGQLSCFNSNFFNPLTTSSTAGGTIERCIFSCSSINTTALTHGGSTNMSAALCQFISGTASAVSVGTGATLNFTLCDCSSSNTNAVTGVGTIQYAGLTFGGASSLINTTTKSARNMDTGGISFNGGTDVLSSYVASTFTPVLAFGGGSTGITYSTQVGKYQRIGNIIFLKITIVLTSKGSSTGAATITGLPVTSASDSANQNLFTTYNGLTVATATYFTSGIQTGVTSVTLSYGVASTGTTASLADTNFSGTDTIKIEGFYFV